MGEKNIVYYTSVSAEEFQAAFNTFEEILRDQRHRFDQDSDLELHSAGLEEVVPGFIATVLWTYQGKHISLSVEAYSPEKACAEVLRLNEAIHQPYIG